MTDRVQCGQVTNSVIAAGRNVSSSERIDVEPTAAEQAKVDATREWAQNLAKGAAGRAGVSGGGWSFTNLHGQVAARGRGAVASRDDGAGRRTTARGDERDDGRGSGQ